MIHGIKAMQDGNSIKQLSNSNTPEDFNSFCIENLKSRWETFV